MSDHRRRQNEAIAKHRDSEAEWTPTSEEALAASPLSTEEAQLVVQRYGGWNELEEGVVSLARAMELLEPLLRDRGEWDAFVSALISADHARERATDAEEVLGAGGLLSKGREVRVAQARRGQNPQLLRFEVERELIEIAETRGEDPAYMENGVGLQATIATRLEGRYPPERLDRAKLKKAIDTIQKKL